MHKAILFFNYFRYYLYAFAAFSDISMLLSDIFVVLFKPSAHF